MKDLSDTEQKSVLLDTLQHFHDFCTAHNLHYSLAYGTLLGAIRHKGFIPWDDDIDVVMPRGDYERFRKLYPQQNSNENYVLHDHRTNPKYAYPFLKISDERTICVGGGKDDIGQMGLFIDIFPIDGMPESPAETKRHMKYFRIMHKFLLLSLLHVGIPGRSLAKAFALRLFKLIPHGNSPQFWNMHIEKTAMKYPMENSRYSGNAVWENTRCQDIPTSTYSKLAKVDFEGRKFWGLAEYDYFLTMCYGDYMTPPPVEQQRGIHIAHCYYKD